MLRIITFTALISVAFAGSLDFSDCSGSDAGAGKIIEVYCDQFSDWADVVLKRGQTYTFGIKFNAGKASYGFSPSIFGIINGVSVPWSGINQNSCTDLVTGSCPLVAGREYHYKASMTVMASVPVVSLTFQWGLTSTDSAGKKGENHACFRMPVDIKA